MSLRLDCLNLLAKDFLLAWLEIHGAKSGTACIPCGVDPLAIIIEYSSSQAARKIAEAKMRSPSTWNICDLNKE
jgi:hypothetical protein